MRPARTLLALAATAIALAPGRATGETPRRGWRTFETDHFRIHAEAAAEELAHHVAAVAERAYEPISRRLNWRPGGRIEIVLADRTDRANGFSRVLPRNEVHAFVAPPEALSTAGEFDDWLELLVTHELTHAVHLDVALGLPRLVNFLSGKTIAPSATQPDWFIEGLAVLVETAGTTGGRLRSPMSDMYLRMATLEGRTPRLDELSHGAPRFPYGTAAYLFGGAFVAYLADRFGAEALADVVHRYAARLLPYGFGRAIREATGEGIEALWDDFLADLRRRYRLEEEEIRRAGLTPARRLTFDGDGGEGALGPRFLPGGEALVYKMSTSYGRPTLVRLDLTSGVRRPVRELPRAGAAAPLPDGRAVVVAQPAPRPAWRRIAGASFTEHDDLARVDLATGRRARLTWGARLHDPDVSPDGRLIAATRSRGAALDLVLVPAAGGQPRTLVGGGRDLAYTPAWSPDGTQIVYARWSPGGRRDLHLLDLRDGRDRALTKDDAVDLDPRFSPDGRHVVFSSDRTGVFNVHAVELATGTVRQVTNVLGGAFQPVVSPDGRTLIFVGFSSTGFDLHATRFDAEAWRPSPPPLSRRGPAPEPLPRGSVRRVTPYRPLAHLLPRAWELRFASNPLGLGPTLGLAALVDDPLRVNDLFVALEVPTAGDPSVRATYSYAGLWPELILGIARGAVEAGGLVVDGEARTYRQHSLGADLTASLPVYRAIDAQGDVDVGFSYYDAWAADRLPGGSTPPAPGRVASLFVEATYDDVRRWRLSVSGQQGRSLRLRLGRSDRRLGSASETTAADWRWTEYFTPPWARLQALAVTYAGGISRGDRQGLFQLGGFEEQGLLRAFFLGERQCCQFLRGYAPGALLGPRFHALSAEYRAPLLSIERGHATAPVYLRRLSGAAFWDAGWAGPGAFAVREVRHGLGAELRLGFHLGYRLESQLVLGMARGVSRGGRLDAYLVSYFPF